MNVARRFGLDPYPVRFEAEAARHVPNLYERLFEFTDLTVFHALIVNRKP